MGLLARDDIGEQVPATVLLAVTLWVVGGPTGIDGDGILAPARLVWLRYTRWVSNDAR